MLDRAIGEVKEYPAPVRGIDIAFREARFDRIRQVFVRRKEPTRSLVKGLIDGFVEHIEPCQSFLGGLFENVGSLVVRLERLAFLNTE